MLPPIIGIVGRSRSGKDSVAEMIIALYPNYHIQRLSTPLKKAICALYDFEVGQLEDDRKEVVDTQWHKSPRETIQSLTNYMMSYMGYDFFTRRLYAKYDDKAIPRCMIIPDIRYKHDIDEIKKRGGIVIKVERNNNRINHLFENNVDNLVGDYTIHNKGTLEDLEAEVVKLVSTVLIV